MSLEEKWKIFTSSVCLDVSISPKVAFNVCLANCSARRICCFSPLSGSPTIPAALRLLYQIIIKNIYLLLFNNNCTKWFTEKLSLAGVLCSSMYQSSFYKGSLICIGSICVSEVRLYCCLIA